MLGKITEDYVYIPIAQIGNIRLKGSRGSYTVKTDVQIDVDVPPIEDTAIYYEELDD
jgi:hypothetical protein